MGGFGCVAGVFRAVADDAGGLLHLRSLWSASQTQGGAWAGEGAETRHRSGESHPAWLSLGRYGRLCLVASRVVGGSEIIERIGNAIRQTHAHTHMCTRAHTHTHTTPTRRSSGSIYKQTRFFLKISRSHETRNKFSDLDFTNKIQSYSNPFVHLFRSHL